MDSLTEFISDTTLTSVVRDTEPETPLAILPPSYNRDLDLKSARRPPDFILDSLPYIEPSLTLETQASIDKIISEEMRTFERPVYLADLPPPKRHYSAEKMQSEMERISNERNGMSVEDYGLDLERYEVQGPRVEQQRTLNGWQRALDNCKAQMTEEMNRSINLHLIREYGPLQWQSYIKHLHSLKEMHSNELRKLEDSITQINRERKMKQLSIAEELSRLEKDYLQTVKMNQNLVVEITRLVKEKESNESSKNTPQYPSSFKGRKT